MTTFTVNNRILNLFSAPLIANKRWYESRILRKEKIQVGFYDVTCRCDPSYFCQLQDVVSLDIDPEAKYGRLWVLDKGNKKCHPKLQIYTLRLNNLISNKELPKSRTPNSIVVDVRSKYGPAAYIGFKEANNLLVFWYKSRSWSVVSLAKKVWTDFLALDFNKPLMYIKGAEGDDLFSLNMTSLIDPDEEAVGSNDKNLDDNMWFILKILENDVVSYEGKFLGPSSGIAVDLNGGLNYYLIRDYVTLRWDTGYVLIFSSSISYV